MTLNDRLKSARESLGKSQKEMAELLDIGLRSWQVYEQGSSVPGGKVFEALVMLGFNGNWLLTGVGAMKRVELEYGLAESFSGADTVNNKPVPFEQLPEINQRIRQLIEMLDLDEEEFCQRLGMEMVELDKIKAGRPVTGLVIRAVAFEFGLRLRWIKMGELPVKAEQAVNHRSRDLWGSVAAAIIEQQDKDKRS